MMYSIYWLHIYEVFYLLATYTWSILSTGHIHMKYSIYWSRAYNVFYLPAQVHRMYSTYRSCHGLVAATGYLDVHFPYRTAGSSFSINDIISSPLPIVVARYFFTLPVPSPSFLSLPSPSGTFRSRSSYVPLLSDSFYTLPPCSS
jgi:hypothetical protein